MSIGRRARASRTHSAVRHASGQSGSKWKLMLTGVLVSCCVTRIMILSCAGIIGNLITSKSEVMYVRISCEEACVKVMFLHDPGHHRRVNALHLWYDKTIYPNQVTFMFIFLPS